MKRETLRVRLLDNVQWERTLILAGTVIVAPMEWAAELVKGGLAVVEPERERAVIDQMERR